MMDWIVSWFILLCCAGWAGWKFLCAIADEMERRHAYSEWAWEKKKSTGDWYSPMLSGKLKTVVILPQEKGKSNG